MMLEVIGLSAADVYTGFIDIILVKGSVIVFVASAVAYALRRSSASTRHAVWAAAFLVLLVLPVLWFAAPTSDITVIGVRAPAVAVTATDSPPVARPFSRSRLEFSPSTSLASTRTASSGYDPVTTVAIARAYHWIVGVWLLGLFVQLARFGLHLLALKRMNVRAQSGPPAVLRRVGELAAELGLPRVPATIVSPDIPVPGTFGVIRPTVLLPLDAPNWPSDQFDAAVLHELAHLRRGDYALHMIAAFVRAVYWVNPAILYAGHRLVLERERACDDGVVAERIDPIRYAEYLMNFAWTRRESTAPSMLSFASRSSLPERVRSLLDRTQTRAPLRGPTRVAIAVITAIAIVPVAAIEIFGLVQSPSQGVAELSDPDPLVRRHAAWAMGESESRGSVESLLARLTDPDPSVRAVAAWSLGEIKDARAVEPLSVLLTDDHPIVREMAVLAIGEIEDPSGLAILRQAGPSVASNEARSWAIAEILEGGQGREVFVGRLARPSVRAADTSQYIDQLEDADPRVRARAAERLGVLGAVGAVDALLDALADEEATVRAAVVWALDEINPSVPDDPVR